MIVKQECTRNYEYKKTSDDTEKRKKEYCKFRAQNYYILKSRHLKVTNVIWKVRNIIIKTLKKRLRNDR